MWWIFASGLVILALGIFMYCIQKDYWRESDRLTGWKKFQNWIYKHDVSYCILNTIGAIIAGVSIIVILILGIQYSNVLVIDNKITMYEEENTKIENQIATVVSNYQQYEQDTFKSVKIEDLTFTVSLYPELKSDTLVQEQIKVYLNNNEQIKQLKTQKLDYQVYGWWLGLGTTV